MSRRSRIYVRTLLLCVMPGCKLDLSADLDVNLASGGAGQGSLGSTASSGGPNAGGSAGSVSGPGACVEGAACDDADLCTNVSYCTGGACEGKQKDCSSFDGDCAQGTCNPASGVCSGAPTSGGTCAVAGGAGVCNVGTCEPALVKPRGLWASNFIHCGVTSSQTVKCWGRINTTMPVATELPGLTGSVSGLSCSWGNLCVTVGTTVQCNQTDLTWQAPKSFSAEVTDYCRGCAVLSTGAMDCGGGTPVFETLNGIVAFSACALDLSGVVHCPTVYGFYQSEGTDGVGPVFEVDAGYGVVVEQYGAPWPPEGAIPDFGGAIVNIAGPHGTRCAVRADGRVFCWGLNDAGQIGDGTTNAAVTPAEVKGLSGPAVLVETVRPGGGYASAAGMPYGPLDSARSCAILTTGEVECWGANRFGQLGNGKRLPSLSPVKVKGLASKAVALSLGADATCAMLDTGTVQCWGRNSVGQLGDGTLVDSLTPVTVANFP